MKGYAKTSLQDLERATGLNKSSLYSEFSDKEDLFHSCVEQFTLTNGACETLVREPRGFDNISAFLSLGKSEAKIRGCFVANSLREYAILPKKTKALISRHLARVSSLMVDNLKALGIEEDRSQTLAQLVLSLNSGLALGANVGFNPARQKIVDELVTLILSSTPDKAMNKV